MLFTACDFSNFVSNSGHVERRQFISCRTKAKLSLVTLSTHEKSSYFIDKSRVMAPSRNLLNVRSVVLVEIYAMWSISDMIVVRSALTEIIVTPWHGISKASKHEGMVASTWNCLKFEIKQRVYEHWRMFVFYVWHVYSKLSCVVTSHRITQIWSYHKGKLTRVLNFTYLLWKLHASHHTKFDKSECYTNRIWASCEEISQQTFEHQDPVSHVDLSPMKRPLWSQLQVALLGYDAWRDLNFQQNSLSLLASSSNFSEGFVNLTSLLGCLASHFGNEVQCDVNLEHLDEKNHLVNNL